MKNFNEELRISSELSDEELDGVNGGVGIPDLPMKSLNDLESAAALEPLPDSVADSLPHLFQREKISASTQICPKCGTALNWIFAAAGTWCRCGSCGFFAERE